MPSIIYKPPRRRPLNPIHCQLFMATAIFVFSHYLATRTAIADQQLPALATDKQILAGELDRPHHGPQSQHQIRTKAPAAGYPYANQRPRITNIGADDRSLSSVGERYPKGSFSSLDQPSEPQNLQSSHDRANMRSPSMPASSLDAHLPSYTSHEQNFSATSVNNPDIDHIFEGSGDGPTREAKEKAKFDDTEEGDDDDDDDYDYRDTLDSGSGQGNDQVADRKKVQQPSVVHTNDQLQRPTESDPYLPFRQPVAVSGISYPPPTIQPSRTTSSYPTFAPTTTLASIEATQPEVSSVEINMATLPPPVMSPSNDSVPIEVVRQTVSSTATPSRIATASSKPLPNQAQETTERPRQSVSTSMTTTLLPSSNNQLVSPTLSIGLSSNVVPISMKLPHSNGSSLSHPSLSKNGDQDYDYADENEDDDSEDISNFEDSEPVDGGFINKTTSVSNSTTPMPGIPPRTVPTTQRPPISTTPAYLTTRPITTSVFPSRPTQRPLPVFDHTNRDIPSKPFASITTTSTTQSPPAPPISINQLGEGGSDDDEDDDEEDDEEEEEAVEEDVSNSELDDDEDEPLPAINRPPFEYPPKQPAPPKWSQGRPIAEFNGGSHRPLKDILLQPHSTENAPPSPSIPHRPENPFGHPPPPPITMFVPITTQYPTTTTTTTKTTPSTTTFRSVSTARPFVYTMSSLPTPPSVQLSGSTQQTAIGYSNTPGDRAVPPITRTSNILGYGQGSPSEDDTDLTRQIYDKAVEVYQATNKAVAAAIEAVWPPKFELNSSTFEPLLAQPMLFMLALGGAVMGLVLVMMLLVYLITYQIQPKDDISIY